MQQPGPESGGDRLGQEDREVRAAARFALVMVAIGVTFLLLAALWVSRCDAATAVDTAACATPQRMLLAAGAPVILAGGGVWAFVRTYRVWQRRGTWWGWHGAGWFLFTLMVVVLTMSGPAMIGSAPAG